MVRFQGRWRFHPASSRSSSCSASTRRPSGSSAVSRTASICSSTRIAGVGPEGAGVLPAGEPLVVIGETPWTRIIEHKWFEFGKDEDGNDLPKTIISREYSSEWKAGDEPYYPVNDEKNGQLYAKYKELADKDGVIFGGRLGEYKYYDMDTTIASVLDMCEKELG